MIRKKVEIEEDFRYAGLRIGVYFSRRMMLGDKYWAFQLNMNSSWNNRVIASSNEYHVKKLPFKNSNIIRELFITP